MGRSISQQAADAAYGWGRPQDWAEALALLANAAEQGEDGAALQHDLATQMPVAQMLTPPTPERLSPVSRIAAARGFAPPGFAAWIIDRAKDRLETALANDAAGDSVRTAKTCAFGPDDRDVITAILQERGAPGDAIFFANVLTDGTPDYRTSHCARPPTRGEKWVLSQWIRAKPFPFGQPPQP